MNPLLYYLQSGRQHDAIHYEVTELQNIIIHRLRTRCRAWCPLSCHPRAGFAMTRAVIRHGISADVIINELVN